MRILLLLSLICSAGFSIAQHPLSPKLENTHKETPHFRVALMIGHTLITDQHAKENFFIPSWGLDLEYWVNQKWGIGLHNDLELETFVIIDKESADNGLERVLPLVVSIDALYKSWKGLVLQLGPGIEFERTKNYFLLRAGIEYEFELLNHWDIAPSIFYDSRYGTYDTWSIALGVGKRF